MTRVFVLGDDRYDMMRVTAISVLALAVLYAAACGGSSDSQDTPTIVPPGGDVLSIGIVVPEDAQVLNGWLYGDEHERLVILSHMRPNDQTAWEPFARDLAEHGYAALTFDFRGYGISAGDKDFDKLDEDLAAVVSFMRERGKEQIFLVGASMGGTASLVVAAEADVDGVVSVSAPALFEGQNATEAIASISAPTLLLAAEDDTAAVVSLEELQEAAPTAEQMTFMGGEHGTELVEGEYAASVQDELLRFLDAHEN